MTEPTTGCPVHALTRAFTGTDRTKTAALRTAARAEYRKAAKVPGPPWRPMFWDVPGMHGNPIKFMLDRVREYGDMVRMRVAYNTVMVIHPTHVERVLMRFDLYDRAVAYTRVRALLGDGLLTSEGEQWRVQRQQVQPAFKKDRFDSYAFEIAEAVDPLIAGWRSRTHIDMLQELKRLTVRVMARSLMGVGINDLEPALAEALDEAFVIVSSKLQKAILFPSWIPGAENRALRRSLARIDDIVRDIIARRAALPGPYEDMLSRVLLGHGATLTDGMMTIPKSLMRNKELIRKITTIIIAGHEGTANSIAWAWYLVSRHPEIEAQLHAEALTLPDRPTMEDVDRLRYTGMVFDETMRLYPTVYVLARKSLFDQALGGYRVPTGTMILLSPYVTHRHAEFWPNPEHFDPERHTPEAAAARPRFAMFPFGGGRRTCLGKDFARTESIIIIAKMAQRYQFSRAFSGEIPPAPMMTLRPSLPMPMRLRSRRF